MRFLLSNQARAAFEQLWDYCSRHGDARLADRILAEMHDAIHRVVGQPTLGHFRPDLTERPLRFFRIRNVFLIYDPGSTPLYVARVYHARQDIKARMLQEAE